LEEINRNRKLLRLKELKRETANKLSEMGLTLKTGSDTEEGDKQVRRYHKCRQKADNLRKRLHDDLLARRIEEFHNSSDFEEMKRQLNDQKTSECFAPPEIEYQLPRRKRIAGLFSEVANVSTSEEIF
jgi:hypothetical protein